jgi:hypothetical protein
VRCNRRRAFVWKAEADELQEAVEGSSINTVHVCYAPPPNMPKIPDLAGRGNSVLYLIFIITFRACEELNVMLPFNMSSTSESLSRTDHLDQDHRAKVEHQGEKINRKRTGSRHTYLSCASCGFWNRKSNTTKKQPQYATQEPWLGIFPKLILRFITLGILATWVMVFAFLT